MPDHPRLRALLEWSLAAFHTGFLFAALVVLLYASGWLNELFSRLDTLLGLGFYVVLWLNTWWTTRRAMQPVEWSTLDDPWALFDHFWRLVFWGGINGLLLFLALLVLIATNPLLLQMRWSGRIGETAPFIAVAIGSVVAFVLGATAGYFFTLLDSALLVLVRRLAPVTEA